MIERVVTALVSDDLRLRETACDLDKVIASGWSAGHAAWARWPSGRATRWTSSAPGSCCGQCPGWASQKLAKKKGGAPVRKLSGWPAACAFGGCRTSAGHARGAAAWSLATNSTSATSSAKHAGAPASRPCRRPRTQSLSGARTSLTIAFVSSFKRWTRPLKISVGALLAR